MGYFEISSKRDQDAVPLSSRVTLADGDIDRITIAYASLYFPNGVVVPEVPGVPGIPEIPATFDADGNELTPLIPAVPEVPGTPASVRPPTGQEVFDAVANGLLQGILANTISVEKTNAAKEAQDSVPPIVVEPGAQ